MKLHLELSFTKVTAILQCNTVVIKISLFLFELTINYIIAICINILKELPDGITQLASKIYEINMTRRYK